MLPELQTKEYSIKTLEIQKGALVLRALNNKLRQQILYLIHSKGTMTVTEIYVQLNLEQSHASQHLGILRKAGFVLTTREGKLIHYSINYDTMVNVQELSQGLLK
jgi:DNA-binding transcriptional ArsR family regulator